MDENTNEYSTVVVDNSKVIELEEEIENLKSNSFKNKYETLKTEHDKLLKTYKNIENEKAKLLKENTSLNEKINSIEVEKEVASTQISFDSIGDNNLSDEILNLDILNMTPLDAMNALYMLQKKAKNSLRS